LGILSAFLEMLETFIPWKERNGKFVEETVFQKEFSWALRRRKYNTLLNN